MAPAPDGTRWAADLLEGVADGFIALDRDWRCHCVNKAAAAFLKTTPQEAVGKILWDAFPRLRDSRFHQGFTRAVQEKTFVQVEDYYEPLGRWYECRCHPTEEGLTVFINDATHHRKLEEIMLEDRQAMQMAIAGSNAGVWRIDLNPELPGHEPDHMYLSPQLKALIGFESDELPNSRSAWLDRILPEDRLRLEEAGAAHAEGRTEVYEVDYRIRHKDGGIRWLARRGKLYRDEFHRPLRWTGVDTDITDRKRDQEALTKANRELQVQAEVLRRSRERYQNLFNSISEAFVLKEAIRDPQGNIVDFRFLEANPAFEAQSGLHDVVGKTMLEVMPDIERTWVENYASVVRTGRPIRCQERAAALGKWFEVFASPAGDSGSGQVAILFNDITARKEAQEKLRRSRELSESLNRISEALHSTLDSEEVMARLLAEGATVLGSDTGALSLRQDNGWTVCHVHGMPAEIVGARMSDDQERHAVLAIESRRPVAIADAWSNERVNHEHLRRHNVRAVLVAPLIVRDEPRGVIFFNCRDHPRAWTEAETAFARQLAATAVIALENANLFAERRQAHERLEQQTQEIQNTNEELQTQTEELRKSEQRLRESEERFRGVFENAAIGIVVADGRRAYLAVNDRFCEITGYRRERLLTMGCADIVHPDDQAADIAEVKRLLCGETTSFLRDLRYIHADGSTLWVSVNVSLLQGKGHESPRIVGVVADITEQKRAEEAVRRNSERFRLLSETASRLLAAEDPLRVAGDLCRRVMEHLDCQVFFNFVTDEKAGRLHLNAWAGISQEQADAIEWLDYGAALCGCVARDGRRIVAEDIGAQPDPRTDLVASYGIRACASHPLLTGGRVIGTLSFGTRTRTCFHEDDLSLMKTVADQVAVAMERIRAQQAVQESEQRLRMALDGGWMGLWEWDLESGHDFWDERVYDLVGLHPSVEARYDKFLRCVDPRDVEMLKERAERSRNEGADFRAEFRLAGPNGETAWVASQGQVLRDAAGKAVRMLGVLFDITRRKHLEEELRRLNEQLKKEVQVQTDELRSTVERLQDEVVRRVLAEGKLRKSSRMLEAFFEHTIAPLAFLDRDFNFVQVNGAYAKAGGKTPEFFKGKNHFDLYPHEENRAIFEKVVRTGKPYRANAKAFIYPDRPERVTYWDWLLMPLRNERDEVQYLVLNLQDATQRQAAVDELEHRAFLLQKLTLELSQAEERERRRMAEVLHDGLQQQLAAAKFHLGLLCSRARDDQVMGEIAGQLDKMLREAIEQSRSLSHELSPAVLYQNDLCETFEWLARQVETKHGLTVHTEFRGSADVHSESIRPFLFRAGQEILFNAVKHAKVQEARLRLQRRGECLWLTIADRGQGFDPRAIGRTAGFGLLSIRERVGLLGGRMRIRSAPGKGSTFLITVPDARTEAAPPPSGMTTSQARAVERRPRASGDRLRVLLVDDHKVMREGLATLIGEQRDMEVVGQAGDGDEAVALARELRPDVVIMDVAMPVTPGDEATRRITAEMPHTRVIALSMFEEPGVRERMLDAGAEAYLPKTGPSEGLLTAIRGKCDF